ncbi:MULTISPECIES: protein kinase domain-containing protein [Nostoc]|uniref:non-specific serine/threonine protein kinase n=2 Tax=Nostoc TaxID=1177 RepID=A0ABR8IIZ0_9NOSO|nr:MULTISPECIES: tetratricopeptide repeat protein [Nostoc]MBD2566117.1 tetratricopeptide repeat protein [Nostoc linckia FACHB-391]MBD2651549.1 tetratricopeptide repeat protein [Nostoc foliaceum FACHB-393]
MSYCINPLCEQRQNPNDIEKCLFCGTSLLINDRIRLIKPLRALSENPFSYTEVFEVDDAGTQWNPDRRQRVMKVLKMNSPKLVELMERESLSLRLIHHPNIPKSTLDDFFTFVPNNSSLTLHCLVMDKIEGQNLEQWIESNGCISQSQALEWVKQLVEILVAVHQANFFHRDIKPSNIILQSNDQLALVDFGVVRRVTSTYLAKISGSGGDSTTRGGKYEITSVGTPRYSPPEQMDGQAVPQSDFYALGRTFIHLLTAIQLIDLPTDKKTGRLIWRNKAPQIDKPFADFIDELTDPLPGQRPQSTQVILQRLKNLPQQIKNYKLANSKIVKYSKVAFRGLIIIGGIILSIPLLSNYLVTQGRKLEAANNSQGAQEAFDWAIKINPQLKPDVSEFYFEKGRGSTSNLDLAKKYYKLAIKYNNQNSEIYTNLAVVCQQLQQFKCVTDNYVKAIELDPNNWQGHYGLGTFYDEQGKDDLAEKQYQLSIKTSSQAILPINNLSRLKIIKGDYSAAIALAQQGLQKAKEPELRAVLYKNLGWALFEQKEYSQAKKYLEKAKELDIHRTSTHCLLAQVQEALGDVDYAWISWEICLLTESREPEVFGWRSQVLERIRLKDPIRQREE